MKMLHAFVLPLSLIAVAVYAQEEPTPASTAAVSEESAPVSTLDPERLVRSVTVSGHGSVEGTPDVAEWTIWLKDTDPDEMQATSSNDQKLEKVLAAAREVGVEDNAIETSICGVTRQNVMTEGQQSIQYLATRQVLIRQDDLGRLADLSALIEGDSGIGARYELLVSRAEELTAEARLLAIRDAQEKARPMVEALGAQLGRVIRLREGQGSPAQAHADSILPHTFRASVEAEFELY
jgi:hypothetical protein